MNNGYSNYYLNLFGFVKCSFAVVATMESVEFANCLFVGPWQPFVIVAE